MTIDQPVPVEPRYLPAHDAAVSIAVHDLARNDGATPLLISHATGFHARCYEPLSRALGDRFDICGLDHRGHGYTEAPPAWDVDWRSFGADTAQVAASEWATGAVVGFGHSMGASSLLMAAAEHPERFAQLLLFEPIAPSGFIPDDSDLAPDEQPLAVGARRRRDTFESAEAAIENFAAKPPLAGFTAEALAAYVEYGFRSTGNGDEVTLRCRPEFESQTYASAHLNGVWELLPDVETPTLIIGGAVTAESPAEWAEPIAERLPNGTYLRLDHLDHFGPMSAPAEVAAVIDDTAGNDPRAR